VCLLTSIIVTVLILERACLFLAMPSHPANEEALDRACSEFIFSGSHNAVHRLLLLAYPEVYHSASQLTEFILTHRLR
jgi:hypothetical protein